VTGQAAWYDLKVDVFLAEPGETGVWPTFDALKLLPGMPKPPEVLRYHTHEAVNLERPFSDALKKGSLKANNGDKR
jgi:hypothetical protein